MKVSDILKGKERGTITVSASTSVRDAMSLLIEHKIGCLPVLDPDESLVGIISDKDIFHSIHKNPKTFQDDEVSRLMSTDLIVGVMGDEVSYIAGIMTNNRIRHIPIVEAKKIIGLISIGDVVKTQIENIEIENRYLKQFIDGNYPG